MKPVLKAAGEGRQRAVERKLYEDLTCHTMDNDITCNIEYYIDDEFHPHRSEFSQVEFFCYLCGYDTGLTDI